MPCQFILHLEEKRFKSDSKNSRIYNKSRIWCLFRECFNWNCCRKTI